jgi:hypothetical protein
MFMFPFTNAYTFASSEDADEDEDEDDGDDDDDERFCDLERCLKFILDLGLLNVTGLLFSERLLLLLIDTGRTTLLLTFLCFWEGILK